jgi:Mg-chelatase subunit ChlD
VATDPELRRQARRLAAVLVPRFGRIGQPRRRGTRRLIAQPGALDGDVDIDRTLERSEGQPPRSATEIVTRQFASAPRSLCLLVDRSGSMSGHSVALAGVAAAAVVSAGGERLRCSVVAFASAPMILADANAAAGATAARPPGAIVGDLLSLRGHGRTDLARALHVAAEQLEASPPGARSALLLSDALHTAGADPLAAAARIERLDVLGTSTDPDAIAAGQALARRGGGQYLPATTLAELTRSLRVLLV